MLKTKRRVVVCATVGVLVLAGAAYAIWTVTAESPGRSRSGTLAAPTVTALSAPGAVPADMFPASSPTGSLGYVVQNPNAMPLVLTAIQQTAPTFNVVGCDGSLVTVPTKSGLSIPIPVGSSDVIVPDAVRLDPTAPTTCQGIAFDTPTSLTFAPAP